MKGLFLATRKSVFELVALLNDVRAKEKTAVLIIDQTALEDQKMKNRLKMEVGVRGFRDSCAGKRGG